MKTIAIVGGIFGIIASLLAMFFTLIENTYTVGNFGLLGIAAGILGIIAAFLLDRKSVLAGVLLIVAAAVGIYAVLLYFLLPGVLMLIAAFVKMTRKGSRY
ncbi:hypothetical protein CHH69_11470 [Terribacillus saccharophilus]|uniref:hypothetical protein n=1 Tax=Terribacillus saccharophilus TaxID=361277 RepID=UPI000BA5C8A4|nr:hypothetical protein [Terribacillus saccharophilus]PAF16522.1 hypothetical protein CHH51_17220 [Terribacillus saccharophilus]PAF36164.1 hypothetical protein CHH69_11470 [Terribacillus saccharophilus]